MVRGLTAPLWPVRPKPFPDELLSSWLVRLAHAHGLKVQTFCHLVFGVSKQLWNRDIDRLAPEWLLTELAERTGTPLAHVRATTLRAYEGWLYQRFRLSGQLPWILVLKMHHRKRLGFGLQYCPRCLRADKVPYFRKRWRVAFNLVCPTHRVRLLDRCPSCGSSVAFHRIEQGRPDIKTADVLSLCHVCNFDLRHAKADRVGLRSDETVDRLVLLCGALELAPATIPIDSRDDHLAVLHHLCTLMYSTLKRVQLGDYVAEQIGLFEPQFARSRLPFEGRSLGDRTEILTLALWLKLDLRIRLRDAWRNRALRYNHMVKDFEEAPTWYLQATEGLSNWRDRC